MQETSELYRRLLSDPNHYTETSLVIGESGSLIDNYGDYITFGGSHILVDFGGAGTGYGHDILQRVETTVSMFKGNVLTVGECPSAEIDITMKKPLSSIPRMARLVPYVRLTNGIEHSEWIQKGVYWLDTREDSKTYGGTGTIKMHGYDTMLKAEVDCPIDGLDWPACDIDVVNRIAKQIGTTLDERSKEQIVNGYLIEMPTGYSAREVLGYIAAAYGGCFVMSDSGQLRMICLYSLPVETSLLCTSDEMRFNITVGGDHIRV